MGILKLWLFVLVVLMVGYVTEAVTHWVVTEKGMIQADVASPLNLRRSYDLIALLDQEKRWEEIKSLREDLMSRKSLIEGKWSSLQEGLGMESIAFRKNECLKNALTVQGLYHIATNGSDRFRINLSVDKGDAIQDVVDCRKYSDLIDGDQEEKWFFPSLYNLDDPIRLVPDNTIKHVMPVSSVNLFGQAIHKELIKDSTSWLHYNLAALYWRIKGDGPKSIDCIKGALKFVPLRHKDIPLHNLAGLVYKAGRHKEAILILEIISKKAQNPSIHYLGLSNIYLSLEDYNNSLLYLGKFLELEPLPNVMLAVKKARNCFATVETHIQNFHEHSLGHMQGILSDFHDFHSLQQYGIRLSKRLMWEHSSYDEELGNFQDEAIFGKKSQRCVKKSTTISCDFIDPFTDLDKMNLENLFQYVETETQKINNQLGTNMKENINFENNNNINKNDPDSYPKFPITMSTNGQEYFDATGWPQESDCNKWDLSLTATEDLKLPIFMPPENKGFDVDKILTDLIGLPRGSEHKLPWYPPICDESNDSGEKYVQQTERQFLNNEIKSNNFLRNHFIKYVNNGKADEAEIGQRIITAMENKAAPKWVLSTLASLYWRLRGNARKALDCLDSALKTAPKDQTDVILTSVGSIVHQLGLENQALKYANLAFKLNYVEPSTNFLLALLHYESNPLMAMYYMKNVLRVDSEYYDGQAELLLKTWGCRIKLGTYNKMKKPHEKPSHEVCPEKDSFKGQGMICSANGEDCKTASIQCFHTKILEGETILKRPVLKFRSSKGVFEGSGDLEPDQSHLERIDGGHLKILPGGNDEAVAPEFYVGFSEDSTTETIFHVYDKSGTYPLSSHTCKEIVEADLVHFTSMWKSVSSSIDISPLLKPLSKQSQSLKPYCSDAALNPSATPLNHLTNQILRIKFASSPDSMLSEWLEIMAGDSKAPVEEIGAKIAVALEENATSWLLATAAALYWRVVGNAEEAVACLKVALNFVPGDMKDVPLIDLANILHRYGFHGDALEIAYLALKTNPNFPVNHFTIGNILTTMGDLDEAINFHRAALALDFNFEPARNRLQAILCTLLFPDSGFFPKIPEI